MEDKKMEKWKQLFENLGYEIEKDNANMLILCKNDDNVIFFNKERGRFWKNGKWDAAHEPITVDELIAINNLFRAYGFFDEYKEKGK